MSATALRRSRTTPVLMTIFMSAIGIAAPLAAAPGRNAATPSPTVERARTLRASGNLRGALAVAEAAAAANPADGAAWALAGDYRYALGDRAGAIEAYEAALSTGFHDARVAALIAQLRGHPSAPPVAVVGPGEGGTAGRDESDFVRALTSFNAGQFARATELAAAITRSSPGHAEAWALLGRCRLARGDRTGALDAFRTSLMLVSDQPEIAALAQEARQSPPGSAVAGNSADPEISPDPTALEADGGASSTTAVTSVSAAPLSGRSAATPVLPGPGRTGDQSYPLPPPSIPAMRQRDRADPEWPLPEGPDGRGVQGPLSGAPHGSGGERGWSVALGAGVAGHGLTVLRDRADAAYDRQAELIRSTGGTASVDLERGGPRVPVGLDLRMAVQPGAGMLARLEVTPSSEDAWHIDHTPGFSGIRFVSTGRRRTGLFGGAAGTWFDREIAPRWRAGGAVSVGGLYGWFDDISESEIWWTTAGPPDRSTGTTSWGGWWYQADLSGEISYALTGSLAAWADAGWRLARVPRMTATILWTTIDAAGNRTEEVRTVVIREPDGSSTPFDFSALFARLGLRLVL